MSARASSRPRLLIRTTQVSSISHRIGAETGGAFVSTSFYDDNGNRTGVCYTASCTTPTDTFAYDWNNRLASATVASTTVDYAYTGDDLRASATVGSTTTTYLWDRLTALPTIVGDGTTRSVHGPSGVLNEAAGTTASYPLQDALGSIRARTDGSGAVTSTDTWDAWGNPRTTPSGTLFGWTGEPRDSTTNLVYLRARDYSSGTGRFGTRDTVSPNAPGTQGYNPYAYATGNPTTFTDPTGNAPFNGQGNAQIGLFGVTTSSFSLYFMATLVGVGGPLLAVGALTAFNFFVVALILFALVLFADQVTRCTTFGLHDAECLGPGRAAAHGVMTAAVGLSTVALTGTAAIVSSCAIQRFRQPFMTGPNAFAACPKPPKPDDDDDCNSAGNELPDFGDGWFPSLPSDNDDSNGGDGGGLSGSGIGGPIHNRGGSDGKPIFRGAESKKAADAAFDKAVKDWDLNKDGAE